MNNRLWWHKTRTTSRSRRLHIRQMMCLRMSFWRPCKARVTKTPPYQDARRRLSEKFRNRGFWPTSQFSSSSKGKGYGHGAKSSSKGKRGGFPDRPRRSLQERIMSTNCKACGRRGHWKAECPFKNAAAAGAGTSSSMPTTTAIVDESILHADDIMPMEFMMLPEEQTTFLDEDQPRGADQMVFLGLAETFVLGNHSQGFRHKPISGDSMNQHEGISSRERLRQWGFRSTTNELRDSERPAIKRVMHQLGKPSHAQTIRSHEPDKSPCPSLESNHHA